MVSKLIAREGTSKGLIFLLENEKEWFLGRDPDLCSLLLEDPKVSRQHALLLKSEDGIIIENLSHTNPILINDVIVSTPTLLKEGDLIKVGGTLFHFTSEEVTLSLPPQEKVEKPKTEAAELPFATIFEEMPKEDVISAVDLALRERFLIKIIAGPQVGSEFSMTPNKPYVIGSDATLCDIILYDLSVSRRHAQIMVSDDQRCTIEDLESRNGVFVNGKQIEKNGPLRPQDVVQLGTTSFILIDRESASKTIVASKPLPPKEEKIEGGIKEPLKSEEALKPTSQVDFLKKALAAKDNLILFVVLLLVLFFIGIGLTSLFEVKEEITPEKDIQKELATLIDAYEEVTYNYNKSTGTLFLVGHVLTPVEKSQLEYNLKGFNFITHLDDTNVVVDQYIWNEMNNLISKNGAWVGVSMHASKPGVFVLTGYLKTRAEASSLTDFLNLNFPYLDRLQNRVAVEEDLMARFNSDLFAAGMNGISVQISNGDMILTGFVSSDMELTLQDLIKAWRAIPGVRNIKNFVVPLSPQEAVINLSDKYEVTGFSTRDNTNINVVVNGHILTRGDILDGMTITSIQSNVIFLEKDGLKFKIEYNP